MLYNTNENLFASCLKAGGNFCVVLLGVLVKTYEITQNT